MPKIKHLWAKFFSDIHQANRQNKTKSSQDFHISFTRFPLISVRRQTSDTYSTFGIIQILYYQSNIQSF